MSNSLSFENCFAYEKIKKKYCRAEQAIDDNMAHEHFMLDTRGYKHIFRICITYYFYTATIVALKRLNDQLQAHFPVLL